MEIVCDLVLLSWNHLEETQACLESLLESTRVPCRLLIVDNGSEPEVRAFLAVVKPRGAIKQVEVLQNERNEGFPLGMNRGIQASRAPYVCLLNNDLRLTVGWLQEMIDLLEAHPTIGVVNPESNTFGNRPPQGLSFQGYADRLKPSHGLYTEVGMCIGFCMLIRRALIEQVGGLSEEVDRFFFEDEDFSMRAQQAGYRCVVARASYVYHAEHHSVSTVPEREAIFRKNQQWCHNRWGRWVRIAWPRFTPVVPASEELRQWLTYLLTWARRRTHIYIYGVLPRGATEETLFRSVGLVPHADIQWRPIPPWMSRWAATGLILTRQKKPFDIIVAPDRRWERSIHRLRPWHRAAVVAEQDEAQLVRQWQQSSRSQ